MASINKMWVLLQQFKTIDIERREIGWIYCNVSDSIFHGNRKDGWCLKMRFLIEYKDYKTKEEKNSNLDLLDTFLNEHCIGRNHGDAFECIIPKFLNNFTYKRKLHCKKLYDVFAVVEIKADFHSNEILNLEDFTNSFFELYQAVEQVNGIKITNRRFEFKELINDLKNAERFLPKSIEELKLYKNIQREVEEENHQKRINCMLQYYKDNPKEVNRSIKGIRIYPNFINNEKLLPYSYMYSEIFANVLRRKGLKLPGYDEIYISIAENMRQAKKEFSLVDWCKYTYSILDIERHAKADDSTKENMVFESISEALRFMADFDHLDENIIEETISLIRQSRLNTELIHLTKENNNYFVQIFYKVTNNSESKVEFKLRIKDKKSGSIGTRIIKQLGLYGAPYSLGKLEIRKDKVIITGRKSFRAEIVRTASNLPDKYIFNIDDLFGR